MRYDAHGRGSHRWAGDVRGDGFFDIQDQWAIEEREQLSLVDEGYLADADLNRDGVISMMEDYALVEGPWRTPLPPGRISDPAGPANPFGYAGYVHEANPDLNLARYRWMDPVLGRWLSRDPIGYADSLNLYLYCGGRVFGFTDPMGLGPVGDFVAALGSNMAGGIHPAIDTGISVASAFADAGAGAARHAAEQQFVSHLTMSRVERDAMDNMRAWEKELNIATHTGHEVDVGDVLLRRAAEETGMELLAEGWEGYDALADSLIEDPIERAARATLGTIQGVGIATAPIGISGALAPVKCLKTLPQVEGRAALKVGGELAESSTRGVAEAAQLRPYGGPGGGHHVPAKSAFTGAPGYDANAALAIPNAEMARLGVDHGLVTGGQMQGYKAFSQTGAALTWESVQAIETQALIRGGMQSGMAGATVRQGIQRLQDAGVSGPTRIPWGGR
ncbi:hypothetical protein PHYC_03759 [Phycisphaerales bacterium]|nr:hypothetical protein PHYC_03759 [Phycisphaerales bacterium]